MRATFASLLFVLACGGPTVPSPTEDAGGGDGGSATDAMIAADAGSDGGNDAGGADTVAVSHAREMRGGWVASVYNINWPSRTGLAAEAQLAELVQILDDAATAGLNAIFLQVRPEGDALYPSELEPWSRFVTGTQGGDPGYDPLAFAIGAAHARGLELHAWMNPYRAKANASSTAIAPHASVTMPEHMRRYGDLLWMDPGVPAVQDHTLAVIRDVLTRYPQLDGLHFDDYFYPYPDGPFPDDATYDAYVAGGGELGRDDWRRDNVNQLVRRIDAIVREVAPHVRWGISPFGIYRPGMPEGIRGLDQYATIFADPVKWIDEGWVDYLAPQLYWPTTQTAQAYEPLAAWWGALAHDGHGVYVGNYLSKVGTEAAWELPELEAQLRIARATPGIAGNIHFHVAPLDGRAPDIVAALQAHHAAPATTPPLASAHGATIEPPGVTPSAEGAEVTHARPLRQVAVYRQLEEGVFAIEAVHPVFGEGPVSVPLGDGTWALSALDRRGVESRAVIVHR